MRCTNCGHAWLWSCVLLVGSAVLLAVEEPSGPNQQANPPPKGTPKNERTVTVDLFGMPYEYKYPEAQGGQWETARKAALTRQPDAKKQQQITDLLNRVEQEVAGLRGKGRGGDLKDSMERAKKLEATLKEAAEEIGPYVVAAVLFEDKQADDRVCRKAIKVLAEYDKYDINDLPMLCRACLCGPVFSPFDRDDPQFLGRIDWQRIGSVRARLEERVAGLLGLKDLKADGDHPVWWLREALGKAISQETDEQRRRIMRNCLVSI